MSEIIIFNKKIIKTLFGCIGSYEKNGKFYTVSPLRNDKTVGSFYIDLSNGNYYDHATNDCGVFFELVSKAFNISISEAFDKIKELKTEYEKG